MVMASGRCRPGPPANTAAARRRPAAGAPWSRCAATGCCQYLNLQALHLRPAQAPHAERRTARRTATGCPARAPAAWSRYPSRPGLDFVFDVAAAVAHLAGPGGAEVGFFRVGGGVDPEHDQGALVVVQLAEFFDQLQRAVAVRQRHRVTVDPVEPLETVRFGLAVGGGQGGMVEEHGFSIGDGAA